MAQVIKRRHPSLVGPPHNTAGPNRWIPKIRIAVGRSILPMAMCISIHGPHQLTPSVTASRPRPVRIIGNSFNRTGNVLNVKLVRNNLPRVKPFNTRVITTDFHREGRINNVKWIKSTLPRVKGRSGRVILSSFYRRGLVIKGRLARPNVVAAAWANWQAAINAGYNLYFEPGPNVAGTYTETFDFGTIFNSILVNLDWNTKNIVGTVSITTTISVSTDNITYDTPSAGTSRFATSARYVRVVVTFTPTNNKSGLNFYNFKCSLSVHRETDAGSFTANSGDVSGTAVLFNKAFKAIDGLTLTAQTTSSYKAVYSNLTATGFNAYVFNDAGARVTATVTWVARGIL